jgi:thiosulfate/3-mercaptopyruvate sulfurtransferase
MPPVSSPLLPPLVDPATLAATLGHRDLVVLDATTVLHIAPQGGPFGVSSGRDGYRAAHLPGAAFADLPGALSEPGAPHHLTLPSVERFVAAARELGIGPTSHVVAYAQESPIWATRLWWLLRYFGFDAVSVLDGGLPAWRAAGLPVERGDVARPLAPPLRARPRRELLATREEVAAIAAGAAPGRLVNALSPEVFRGEGPTSYSRPGRIPRSANVPWFGLIDPQTNRFLARERLAAAFGSLDEATTIVAYCGAGASATLDLFALALLGREGRLYDGSLAEWTADPERPVELGP